MPASSSPPRRPRRAAPPRPVAAQFAAQISAVRDFNRFYTRRTGLLEKGLLRSGFTLTEARVLYELAHRDGPTAAALARDLGLDPGYLSRILKRFSDTGLLRRARAAADGRQSVLRLTAAGEAAFRPLDAASQAEIGAMLGRLAPSARARAVAAMREVQALLTDAARDRPAPATPDRTVLRAPRPGDLGWIVHRQAVLYAEEYGFDWTYEALIARIAGDFATNFEAARERAWVAEHDGAIAGSVFVVRADDETAKLRLLYVEPAARGLGLGRRLVAECIAFARDAGYRTLTLWTNDNLDAARHIYATAGFEMVDEAPHRSFGKDLVGQTWVLDLRT